MVHSPGAGGAGARGAARRIRPPHRSSCSSGHTHEQELFTSSGLVTAQRRHGRRRRSRQPPREPAVRPRGPDVRDAASFVPLAADLVRINPDDGSANAERRLLEGARRTGVSGSPSLQHRDHVLGHEPRHPIARLARRRADVGQEHDVVEPEQIAAAPPARARRRRGRPRGAARLAARGRAPRVSTSPPREVLTSTAPGFMRPRAASSIRWCVSGVSGACRVTKSERASSSSSATCSAPSRASLRGGGSAPHTAASRRSHAAARRRASRSAPGPRCRPRCPTARGRAAGPAPSRVHCAGAHHALRLTHAPRGRQHQRHRQLGRGVREHVRSVRHDHAAGAAGRRGRCCRSRPRSWRRPSATRRPRPAARRRPEPSGRRQRGGAGDARRQVPRSALVDVEPLGQHRAPRLGQVARDHHPGLGHHATPVAGGVSVNAVGYLRPYPSRRSTPM